MADRIFIEPLDGKYKGQLLVFDVVKSMNHIRSATTFSHSVEHLNTNISDHRYRGPASVMMSGYVSDSWDSTLIEEPDGSFKDYVIDEENLLIDVMGNIVEEAPEEDIARQARLFRDTQLALNGEEPDLVWGDGPDEDFTDEDSIKEAQSIFKKKNDTNKRKEEKGLDFSDDISNSSKYGLQINTIQQAIEVLNNIDQESVLCDVHSKYEVYENMVLENFSNPLKAGAESQAYHFSLMWKEQNTANILVSTRIIFFENSELAENDKLLGKDSTKNFDKSDPLYTEMSAIWEDAKRSNGILSLPFGTDDRVIRETKVAHIRFSVNSLTLLERAGVTRSFALQAKALTGDPRNLKPRTGAGGSF